MIRQVRAPEFEYPSQNTASSRQKWLAQRSLSPQHSNDRKGRKPVAPAGTNAQVLPPPASVVAEERADLLHGRATAL